MRRTLTPEAEARNEGEAKNWRESNERLTKPLTGCLGVSNDVGHDEPEGSHNRTAGHVSTRRKHAAPPFPSLPYFTRAENAGMSDKLHSLSAGIRILRLASHDKLKFVGHFLCRSCPTKHIPLTSSRSI